MERTGLQLGNYRLVQQIGQGGFADVYLGEHVYLNTQAAIKVLRTQLERDDTKGFQEEARMIAGLRHPHIVRVLDFDVQHSKPYLVMDYAPKGTLRKRYPRGTQLPLSVIVPAVRQVGDALHYAHEKGIVHRDVKPENMLIGANDEILLSDFGIATMTQSSHYQTQSIVGTIAYMAPEQVQGKPCAASDQYALAVITYEWLTGRCPFTGSFTEVAAHHLFALPPPIRALLPEISPDIEQVITIALAKDANRRFASVQAFAHALEQASGGEETVHVSGPTVLPVTPYPPTIRAEPRDTPVTPITPLPVYVHTPPPSEMSVIAAPSVPPPAPVEQRTSRRAFLLYVGSGVAALAAAGAAGWVLTHPPGLAGPAGKATPAPTPTNGQATPVPTNQPTQAPTAVPTTATFTGPGSMYTASWQPPGGSYIASGGQGVNIEIWQSNTGGGVTNYPTPAQKIFHLAWSSDGNYLAAAMGEGFIQVWAPSSGQTIFSLQAHSNDYVNCVAWSPDNSKIVTAGGDGTAIVWDVASQSQLFQYTHHTGPVNAVAWSHQGDRIVSGSEDTTAQVWSASDGTPLVTYNKHRDRVLAVAWGPGTSDSRIASASDDSTVQVWDSSSGTREVNYTGHTGFVVAMDWSPDGAFIASGGTDTMVRVWDASSGQGQRTYTGHTSQVEGIAWSPDSAQVASASDDGTVRVWPGR